MDEEEEFEANGENEDPLNYPHSMSSDWSVGGTNASMGFVPVGNSVALGGEDLIGLYSCSSASLVDCLGPNLWDQSTNFRNMGSHDFHGQSSGSSSSALGIGKGGHPFTKTGIDKTLEIGWNQTIPMLKGGIFLPKGPGMHPSGLSPISADISFIKRAARFSYFSGGKFSKTENSFGSPHSTGFYKNGLLIHGTQEVASGSGPKSTSGGQSNKTDLNVGAAISGEHQASKGSPLKNKRRNETLVRSQDEAKHGIGGSNNKSAEGESSGGTDGQDNMLMLKGTDEESSAEGLNSKKRKRIELDVEIDQGKAPPQEPSESIKVNCENQEKDDHKPTSVTHKTTGKQTKQGSQASDQPKVEYIHVRARHGQATNSHSLAERVRREKISERMKFLQDLVPGCSKVTGKAVMLDEIINYVQSLQRQVEFLSMKLATVNLRLDFNLEELLSKDIFWQQVGPSRMRFAPEMPMTCLPLHSSHPGLDPAGLSGMTTSSDAFMKTIQPQSTPLSGRLKEPNQIMNVWDEELPNIVQMDYATTAPHNSQDLDGSFSAGHAIVEL